MVWAKGGHGGMEYEEERRGKCQAGSDRAFQPGGREICDADAEISMEVEESLEENNSKIKQNGQNGMKQETNDNTTSGLKLNCVALGWGNYCSPIISLTVVK